MNVDTLALGPFEANSYVLAGENRRALVIDPGAEADRLVRYLETRGLGVAAYVLTHGHIDHLSALPGLLARFPAPVALHPADAAWAFASRNTMQPFYPPPPAPLTVARELAEGQSWTDAGLTYRILETPGHTPGSVCLFFEQEQALFTGDTLFAGSVGRTDLTGGDSRALARSLKRLAALPDTVSVYPGHGPATAIGREKKANYFLREKQHARQDI
ncbi:MAG: MBL fold metallo-hydrolase [Lentisphaerae bacterium]|nr:MBL fold metallo-hydrolase [Lentisphaerota bacterium]